MKRFISKLRVSVQGVFISVRIYSDSANAQLFAGAHDADGDLAAIGDEQAADPVLHDGYASATSIFRPSAPMTMAKILLSERSEVRCANRAPKGASTMLPTVNPIRAGT